MTATENKNGLMTQWLLESEKCSGDMVTFRKKKWPENGAISWTWRSLC